MTESSLASCPILVHRPGLLARLGMLAAIFFADKVLLNRFVDFDRAQAADGLGAVLRNAQHWGFRFLVAAAAATVLLAAVRDKQELRDAAASIRAAAWQPRWMLVHGALMGCLIPLTALLYPDGIRPLSLPLVVILWTALALSACVTALLSLACARLWWNAARSLGVIWCYAAVAAFLGASAMQLSQRLWAPTAALTFDLVRRLLAPLIPTLHADPVTRILSTDRFAVVISEICSGLEGMGLILAFCAAWLLYFRREYIFPRALLLIPAGLLAVFSLNIVRIAAIMLIGHAGFADVAEYGFHSQAGWIAFITVTCALVYVSRRSAWLNRTATKSRAHDAFENPTAAYLLPLLAILAAGALSHAMSGTFETCYPLRLLAVGAVLYRYRAPLLALDRRCSWRGVAVGALVFLVWVIAAYFFTQPSGEPEQLTGMPPLSRALWIMSRVAASVVTVPIAEELAYRGYLMRRLTSRDFQAVPYRLVGWAALGLTAAAFGMAHGSLWIPGIIAGLAYGVLVKQQGSLGEAIVAHATTNALLAAAVLLFGQWQLW